MHFSDLGYSDFFIFCNKKTEILRIDYLLHDEDLDLVIVATRCGKLPTIVVQNGTESNLIYCGRMCKTSQFLNLFQISLVNQFDNFTTKNIYMVKNQDKNTFQFQPIVSPM